MAEGRVGFSDRTWLPRWDHTWTHLLEAPTREGVPFIIETRTLSCPAFQAKGAWRICARASYCIHTAGRARPRKVIGRGV